MKNRILNALVIFFFIGYFVACSLTYCSHEDASVKASISFSFKAYVDSTFTPVDTLKKKVKKKKNIKKKEKEEDSESDIPFYRGHFGWSPSLSDGLNLYSKEKLYGSILPLYNGDSFRLFDRTDTTHVIDTILYKKDSILIKQIIKNLQHYHDSIQYVKHL